MHYDSSILFSTTMYVVELCCMSALIYKPRRWAERSQCDDDYYNERFLARFPYQYVQFFVLI
jgi:hypothetical protein